MIGRLLNIVAVVFCCSHVYSQMDEIDRIFIGSPDANALTEYAKVPVNSYHGLVDISLPIVTLKGRGTVVPVTISYHSAGNKVNEVSSSVGLGWTLNAGGLISRVVRGLPDDEINGYCGLNQRGVQLNNTSISSMSTQDRTNYITGTWDSEPDLYLFNFLGKTGKFTLDPNGNVISMPENDFIIEPSFGQSSTNNYWSIRDKNGFEYRFGIDISHKEVERVSRSKIGTSSNPATTTYPTREFVTSWYLSSIISPTNEVITFNYANGDEITFVDTSEEHNSLGDNGGFEITTTTRKILNPVIIENITSDFGEVEFTNDARLDIANGIRISGLKLLDHNSNVVKKFNFNQAYFNSLEGCGSTDCKRLKLSNVYEFGANGGIIKKYRFEYNNNKLPKRGSPQIDHWGYFNNNGAVNLIDRSDPQNINAYRGPNQEATKSNVLEKIIYPTGGHVKFNYELNEYSSLGTNYYSGGLRIKSIEYDDLKNAPRILNYTYTKDNTAESSGIQFGIPIYSNTRKEVIDIGGTPYDFDNIITASSSFNELFDLNGSSIGYSESQVTFPDGGKEEWHYTNFLINPDIRDIANYFSIYENGQISGYLDPFESPFGPPSKSMDYQRGLLKEKITKDNQGNVLHKITNEYEELDHAKEKLTVGYKFSTYYNYSYFYEANCSKYYIRNGSYQLVNSIETTFLDPQNLESQNTFTYSYSFPTLTKSIETLNSDNELVKTEFEYPFELVGVEFDKLSLANNIENFVVKKTWVSNELISREKRYFGYDSFGYYNNGDALLPKKTSNQKSQSSEYHEIEVVRYDPHGNIIEYREPNGQIVSVLWGYNHRYPVAEIKNASYDEISDNQVGLDFTKLELDNPTSNDIVTEINKVSNYITKVEATIYIYHPLVGLQTIIYPNGDSKSFKYDEFGQLKYTKDLDGYVLTKNEYHYVD